MQISKLLNNDGFLKLRQIKKPLLKQIDIDKRKIFYDQYKDTDEDFWSNIMFSDESKVCLEPHEIRQWMTRDE